MSVAVWFVLGLCVAAFLYAWRYYAGRIAWNETKNRTYAEPRAGDILWGLFCGFGCALMSPIIFPAEQAFKLIDGRAHGLFVKAIYTPEDYREHS